MYQPMGEIETLAYEVDHYDLEGLIRLIDNEEGIYILTFEEVEEQKHYQNRYERLETHYSMDHILNKVHQYLEADETHGVFLSFAVMYQGHLQTFSGRPIDASTLDLGELELGDHMIYGMLIKQIETQYSFEEVLYFDGQEKSHSWAERVLDGGELTFKLKAFIEEFGE